MNINEIKHKLKNFIIFSTQDIKKADPNFYNQRLSEWQKRGIIVKLRKKYYTFSDLEFDERSLFLIANTIYPPSYISLEVALSFYNLIPEGVYSITSVSSNKTDDFQTKFGRFTYQHIKPQLFFGYRFDQHEGRSIKIAEPEKAVLDFLYLNPSLKTRDDFSELRVNEHEFKAVISKSKLLKYSHQFNNKSLAKRLNTLLKTLDYA